jgi:hypothetical protein
VGSPRDEGDLPIETTLGDQIGETLVPAHLRAWNRIEAVKSFASNLGVISVSKKSEGRGRLADRKTLGGSDLVEIRPVLRPRNRIEAVRYFAETLLVPSAARSLSLLLDDGYGLDVARELPCG